MVSKKHQINKIEIERVLKNALIFAAPALIVFLTQLQAGVSFEDAVGALYVWGLGVAIDFLRKWNAGK